jgi:hypothetical protein
MTPPWRFPQATGPLYSSAALHGVLLSGEVISNSWPFHAHLVSIIHKLAKKLDNEIAEAIAAPLLKQYSHLRAQ